jgi:hypothetical protein
MIKADNLGNIKMLKPIIPTFEDVTQGKTIIVEMNGGIITEYHNEGRLEIKGKYKSIKHAASAWYSIENSMETFHQCYTKSKKYTEIIKAVYHNVKNVYIGDL